MSRFFTSRFANLTPYVPGEQPRDGQVFVKLNTNENPYPPPPAVFEEVKRARPLNLYPDTECTHLRQLIAEHEGISPDEIVITNGSDEILNFAFMAFCDDEHPAAFPDITYGFYPVFAKLNHIPYTEIPLRDDFSINLEDYLGINQNIFIANPNAPTGIALSVPEIEKIVASNPENLVVIDEAYVDFGAQSCVSLISRYPNLLITRTFSKSGFLAGARLGYGIACRDLIKDINTIRFSTNPYNINNLSMAAGVGVYLSPDYTREKIRLICETREKARAQFEKLGFEVLPSSANFLFVRHPAISGESLYLSLKQEGVLIRHFTLPRIVDFNRITIGTPEQMNILFDKLSCLLPE